MATKVLHKVKILTQTLKLKTQKGPEFIDITDRVASFVDRAKVRKGLVSVYSLHTTAAIKINENEPLLIRDMEKFLVRLSPKDSFYNHNDFKKRTVNLCDGECANGHSHCQHLPLSASETIPIIGGKMKLGLWQRIFLVELDRARERQVVVQVLGE